jgi:hypothetical protein
MTGMNNLINWEGISTPKSNLNVRKLAIECSHDLFIGKNEHGNKILVICLKGDQGLIFKKYKFAISGFEIDLRQDSDKTQNLVITLESNANEDIFTLLINSIISSIENTVDSSAVLHLIFKVINRWKLFLANRRIQTLTTAQVRGLYAELTFLMTLLAEVNIQDYLSVLEAWKGPEKTQHDFIFNNISIEIKSLNGDERSTVRISSEDQLESKFKKLALKIYTLGESENSEKSLSLNNVVESIYSTLESHDLINIFCSKLSLAGYLPLDIYNKPCFYISSEKTFSVAEGFPRLTRDNLPFGIVRTNYEIQLSEIIKFEINNIITWRS